LGPAEGGIVDNTRGTIRRFDKKREQGFIPSQGMVIGLWAKIFGQKSSKDTPAHWKYLMDKTVERGQ